MFSTIPLLGFDKIIIWGHKLHTHTHSYIHYGFYRACTYMGYPTYWFDDNDDISQFNFSNSLFITEHQVDTKIPIRQDCFYVVHPHVKPQYDRVSALNRVVTLRVFVNEVLSLPHREQYEPFVYFDIPNRSIYLPWATDLLPEEIDRMKEKIKYIVPKKRVCYLGTIGHGGEGKNINTIKPFIRAAIKDGFEFISNDPWAHPLDPDSYVQITQESLLAPALQGEYQVNVGYIPCRIFKNISYGCMGITNSLRVWELFEGKIVYDANPRTLYRKAKNALDNHTLEKQYELMDFVKNRHTYINRVQALFEFIKRVANEEYSQ